MSDEYGYIQDPTPKILSVAEVARAVGRSLAATRRAIERGQLPARRWGRRVVVLASELDNFVKSLPPRARKS